MTKADFLRNLPDTNECIDWPFALGGDGYPYCWFDGRVQKATRVCMKIHGNDPGRLHALHRCDRPSCVNPRHLFAGSHRDNMKDASDKGRIRYAAKLSVEQVAEIRASSAAQLELAAKFGVSQSHISRLLSGSRNYWRGT